MSSDHHGVCVEYGYNPCEEKFPEEMIEGVVIEIENHGESV